MYAHFMKREKTRKQREYKDASPSDEEKFDHKKSLGQHFLTSDYAPKKMCDAAEVMPGDIIFEIGPGTGALTEVLLARGATVIALEADPRAIEELAKRFEKEIASGQLCIHHGDARHIDFTTLKLEDHNYKVVANIPYYISGLLFRALLESTCQPKTLVFLVQKEVATRIARDKKESLLSLSIKVFGVPRYVETITKGHFTPPPKVDSAIIAVTDIGRDAFKNVSQEHFFSILHLGFGQKRKQLLSNLTKAYNRDFLEGVFTELDVSLTIRAEDVSIEKWLTLIEKLESTAISPT